MATRGRHTMCSSHRPDWKSKHLSSNWVGGWEPPSSWLQKDGSPVGVSSHQQALRARTFGASSTSSLKRRERVHLCSLTALTLIFSFFNQNIPCFWNMHSDTHCILVWYVFTNFKFNNRAFSVDKIKAICLACGCYRSDSIFDLLIFSQGTKIILFVLFLTIICIWNENTVSLRPMGWRHQLRH